MHLFSVFCSVLQIMHFSTIDLFRFLLLIPLLLLSIFFCYCFLYLVLFHKPLIGPRISLLPRDSLLSPLSTERLKRCLQRSQEKLEKLQISAILNDREMCLPKNFVFLPNVYQVGFHFSSKTSSISLRIVCTGFSKEIVVSILSSEFL